MNLGFHSSVLYNDNCLKRLQTLKEPPELISWSLITLCVSFLQTLLIRFFMLIDWVWLRGCFSFFFLLEWLSLIIRQLRLWNPGHKSSWWMYWKFSLLSFRITFCIKRPTSTPCKAGRCLSCMINIFFYGPYISNLSQSFLTFTACSSYIWWQYTFGGRYTKMWQGCSSLLRLALYVLNLHAQPLCRFFLFV